MVHFLQDDASYLNNNTNEYDSAALQFVKPVQVSSSREMSESASAGHCTLTVVILIKTDTDLYFCCLKLTVLCQAALPRVSVSG